MSELSGHIRFSIKKNAKRQADIEPQFHQAMLKVCMVVAEEYPGVEITTSDPILTQILSERLKP